MTLGIGQYSITKEEGKYSLPFPGKHFGQKKSPRNGNSKLINLGSSGFSLLSAFVKWSFFSKGVGGGMK